MDDQILDLLASENPNDRKRAVKALAQSGEAEALDYLADAYKFEDDPEVKALIVKAGKYIKKQQQAPKWEAQEVDEPESDEPEPEHVEISPMQEKRAESLFGNAMNFVVRGENDEALKQLKKALEVNPNLRYDARVKGLASEILNTTGDAAMDILMSGDAMEAGKSKRKPKRKTKDGIVEEEVTWGTALTDLAIYALVMAGIVIVGMLLVFQQIDLFAANFTTTYADALLSQASYTMTTDEYWEFEAGIESMRNIVEQGRGALLAFGIVGSLIYGLMYAVFNVIMLFITYIFLHFTATGIMGGDGTLPRLINKTALFITGISAFSMILSIAMFYLMFNGLFDSIATAATNPDVDPAIIDTQLESIFGTINTLSCVSGIVSLIALFWYGSLVGEAYDFGMGRGCVTILVGSILMMVVAFACGCAFSAILGSAMESLFTSSLSWIPMLAS